MHQVDPRSMIYLFENLALDTDRRELRRAGTEVSLEPQVFDLLEYLIRNRERVVSKDDLLASVWHGRIVSESTLSTRITAARSAIGDSGEQQRLIKTLSRKGIRFVGSVSEQQAPPAMIMASSVADSYREPGHAVFPLAAAAAASEQPTHSGNPSLAVLPFVNMGGDAQYEYFADGMADEIITALSRCGGLLVIARNSSFSYKGKSVDARQIGRELGVRYMLEGSVRRGGSRLRFTGQLIDAASGAQIWADRFEGAMSDVFELQDQIASSVVAAIEPKIEAAEIERLKRKPPANLGAYDLLLRAKQLESEFTNGSLLAAFACVEAALKIDPSYAPAMALGAYCHAVRHVQGWVDSPKNEANWIRLAWRAVELGKDDANVLWMSAYAVWRFERNAQRAKELAYRSLLINPNSATALAMIAWMEATTGNPSKAFELIGQAQRLNPRMPRDWFMSTAMAVACFAVARFDEAVTWSERAVTQNRRFVVALRVLASALAKLGQRERAADVVREILHIEPHLTVSMLRASLAFQDDAFLAEYCGGLRLAGLPE
jgi:TolB-like protein